MYSIKSKKVMKFNKFTHLSIIVVLAIVFIVVYLYYTISDVKKIHSEVSKLTDDITKMNANISNITSTLTVMLAPQPQPSVCTLGSKSQQCLAPAPAPGNAHGQVGGDDESSVNAQELQAIIETIEDEEEQIVNEVVEEPKQFVVYQNDVANLDDLKDVEELMSQQPQTLKDASKLLDITTVGTVASTVASTSEAPEDLSKLSLDELKSVGYETIRKYCKNNGLNYKGTKDVLIYRIKGVTA